MTRLTHRIIYNQYSTAISTKHTYLPKMSQRIYPKTYLKFEGTKEINGKRRQFWIQDATEDMFEEIEHQIFNYFIDEEPIDKYTKIKEDPQSMIEYRFIVRTILEEKYSLVCLTKDEQNSIQLAGFNLLTESRSDLKEAYHWEGFCMKRLYKIFNYIEEQRNFHEVFNMQRIMKAMGLYVLRGYRGEGLGARLLEAREYLCRNVGITATLTAFTSIVSQKMALRGGYKDFYEIEYEELGRIDSGMHIPDIHQDSKSLKYMYKVYE